MAHPLQEQLGNDSQLVADLCVELDDLLDKIERSTARKVSIVVLPPEHAVVAEAAPSDIPAAPAPTVDDVEHTVELHDPVELHEPAHDADQSA